MVTECVILCVGLSGRVSNRGERGAVVWMVCATLGFPMIPGVMNLDWKHETVTRPHISSGTGHHF